MNLRTVLPLSAIIAATGLAALAVSAGAAPPAPAGDQSFKQRCQMCHALTPGGASGPLAPNLRGVVGRKAGSTAFKTYSPALKGSSIVWNAAKLDAYLAAPGKTVPGTRMVIAVSDPAQRKAIIAYLATQR